MQHPFAALAPEYTQLLRTMQVTQVAAVDAVARKLLGFRARYAEVSQSTTVPIVVLATLHERESDANFHTNLAQGDPLSRPSVHVPAGRPKLLAGMSFPVTWEFAAIDAINYDHLNDNSAPWSMIYACWKGEAWNGFGPRNHGIHTGYLWGGCNHYVRGKYIADGVWDPNAVDKQLGIVPVMARMVALDSSLALPGAVPSSIGSPPIVPQPAPMGVGGGGLDVRAMQHSLNLLNFGPLIEDGSYGRRTREAVRAFQAAHQIKTDGLAGPITFHALERALASLAA